MRLNILLLYFVAFKHLIWGIVIISTPFVINTSTLATINSLFVYYWAGGIALITSSLIAIYGLKRSTTLLGDIIYLIPLQFFVWLAALTAVNAVLSGHYADGVIRPRQFIFVDQLTHILLSVFVTIVVFEPLWNKLFKSRGVNLP